MPRYSLFAIIAALIVAGALGAWLYLRSLPMAPAETSSAGLRVPAAPAPTQVTPGVEVQYLNSALKFSFGVPDGLLSSESDNAHTVTLYDAAGADHIFVHVVPAAAGDAATFTAAMVRQDAPGTAVARAEQVTLPGGVTALEFDSQSDAWQGASRELRFAYKGNRYQVSVPIADAKLLDFVRDSWQWRQ